MRLTGREGGFLSIGIHPRREYAYDGRGPGSIGTMWYDGEGTAKVLFPKETANAPDLTFAPGLPIYVKILPDDMEGTIDFCSGDVELALTARLRPVFFGRERTDLLVDTTLTTGSVTGAAREIRGQGLDEKGDLVLVAVSAVPETGDPLIDGMLGLPTEAAVEDRMHLDFPAGRFCCSDECSHRVADTVHMLVAKEGLLAISFLGSVAEFPYDGRGSDGVGTLVPERDGTASIEFFDFHVPPLQFVQGFDGIMIDIVPHSLSGRIDMCTGRIDLDFDATFTPCIGSQRMTSISIVTTITTETSAGYTHSLVGERLNMWGDALLVGVAKVPPTGDPAIDMLLDLPNDALCRLPVHLDFVGGEPPACPRSG